MTEIDTQQRAFRLTLKTASFIILVLAIGVSTYLSYLKYDATANPTCLSQGAFDCHTVLNSAYSEIMDVPIAYLGLGTNLVILALLLAEYQLAPLQNGLGVMLVFGVVLFAFIFSVYLVYLQAFVIKSYCQWCLSHEALITILFVLSGLRLSKSLSQTED